MIYLIAAVTVFAAGAGVGFLALIALGIRREERRYTMTIDAPDTLTRGARAANGLHALHPGVLYEEAYQPHAHV